MFVLLFYFKYCAAYGVDGKDSSIYKHGSSIIFIIRSLRKGTNILSHNKAL